MFKGSNTTVYDVFKRFSLLPKIGVWQNNLKFLVFPIYISNLFVVYKFEGSITFSLCSVVPVAVVSNSFLNSSSLKFKLNF